MLRESPADGSFCNLLNLPISPPKGSNARKNDSCVSHARSRMLLIRALTRVYVRRLAALSDVYSESRTHDPRSPGETCVACAVRRGGLRRALRLQHRRCIVIIKGVGTAAEL